MEQKEWYNNKELFEMLEGFKKEVAELRVDMKETKTLIRNYNGLREDIINLKIKLETHIAQERQEEKTEEKQARRQKNILEEKQVIIAVVSLVTGIIIGVAGWLF